MKEFRYNVRVYYSDTDCGAIVYHARYLDFAEHARTEMLRSALPDSSQDKMREEGLIFVVKSITIDYKRPGHLDDELVVTTVLSKAEHFSATFTQSIKRGDEELASLSVKVAAVSYKTNRIMKIPYARHKLA